jgi:predicted ribonuclease YlaK
MTIPTQYSKNNRGAKSMGNKYGDIKYKWLSERGLNVFDDALQTEYVKSLFDENTDAVFAEGKAGTGKTVLALLVGAYLVEKGEYDRIIYVRNTVPVRDVGFLKGDLKDKTEPYMTPAIEALDLVKAGTYEVWSQPHIDKIRCISTAFARGVTWNNAWIVLDEAQNFELSELRAAYTRAKNSKIVTVGSLRQIDNMKLKRFKGYTPFELYMQHFQKFDTVRYHTLTKTYRSEFADWADEIEKTIEILEEKKCQVKLLGQ